MTDIPEEFPLPEEAFERQRALMSRPPVLRSVRVGKRRRRLIAAFSAAALLGLLLATSASGIGGRLLDVIHGKKAPAEVKTYFAYSSEARAKLFASADKAGIELKDQFSPVIADEARGVFAIETPDGPIYLWAAPTEDGRQCWLLQALSTPGGSGSCDGIGEQAPFRPEILSTEERPSVQIVHARISDDTITAVDVLLDDAPRVPLAIADGHALGTVSSNAKITALVARNATGEEVARVTLR